MTSKKSLLTPTQVFRIMKSVCEKYPNINREGIGKEVDYAYCITYADGKYCVFENGDEVVGYGTYDSFFDAFKTFIDLQTNDYVFAEKMEEELKRRVREVIKTSHAMEAMKKVKRFAKKEKNNK